MKKYVYLLSCPDKLWWPIDVYAGTLIQELADSSRSVTYETMKKHCQGLNDWLLWIGIVDTDQGLAGLFRKISWVDFRKGTYDDMPAYFVVWSSIEFVWVHQDALRHRGIKAHVAPWKTGKKWYVDTFAWLRGS